MAGYIKLLFKGELYPNQNLACYVSKLSTLFWKKNISILKQVVIVVEKLITSIKILVEQTVLELSDPNNILHVLTNFT